MTMGTPCQTENGCAVFVFVFLLRLRITCRLINGVVARFTLVLADESQETESVGYVD